MRRGGCRFRNVSQKWTIFIFRPGLEGSQWDCNLLCDSAKRYNLSLTFFTIEISRLLQFAVNEFVELVI